MKINIKPFHFTELLNKGYSLDGLYLLELIQNEKDVESLSKENSKIGVLLSSLRRKELIKEGKLELTLKGQELLQFLDTKAKPLKIKKTDDSEFTKWWNTFPGTDTFVHNNQQFKGARSLRVNKDACRVKFEKIIWQKTKKFIQNQENWQEIESKAEGAVNFFFGKVKEEVFKPFKDFYAETKGVKGMKQYNDDTRTFLDDLEEYLNDLKNVHLLDKPLFDQKNDEEISVKVVKIPTQNITLQLFEEGKSIGEIAKERGILVQTVFGHLGKFVENGQLEIERIIAKEYIQDFKIFYKTKFIENPEQYESLNELKRELPHMEFHELRVLRDYFRGR